ncbi:hypothetical protein NC652_024008 [Populus alba x Populus x berolinensis]|uniref:Uncharacterized protein n=1 Tax=Populus alba x Populus x berolinensis TaxID=444605 RepID=A0AAD6QB95_9ROSI|nr:hypothetical protein NC652_024008 [Populus alba x Populus x berolinensis]KAJ6985821.1 hypothetical protein NC653_023685 [Populus alba x Populus x berolinensis]
MDRCLEVSEGKASPKRDFRALRVRNHRSLKSNLLESIAQVNAGNVVSHTNEDEDGFVRMKFVVRKQDLKQMLELMRGCESNPMQQRGVAGVLGLLHSKVFLKSSYINC